MDPMKLAIKEAMKGIHKGEGGPFGAVIVGPNGKVIAKAHNTVWKDTNPTAHAEINAIKKACKKLGTIDLSGCTIYSTTEPCPMCFSAIHWARIDKIVYGTRIEDAAEAGFNEMHVHNEKLKRMAKLKVKLVKDYLREECKELFKEWIKIEGENY